MIPNWNIGPVARRRLDEMARAGFDSPYISFPKEGKAVVIVSAYNSVLNDSVWGTGNTIGQAVAEAYKAWKKHRGKA